MRGVGLIGIGVHGARYARHLLAGDVAGARLVAVSRRDEAAGRRAAAGWGVPWLPVADLMADPAVDVVVLAVEPGHHRALVTAALRAGKPVLVEKPLAPSGADARALLAEARSTGVPLGVAHTLRYSQVARALHDRARAGAIGALHSLSLAQHFEPSSHAWLDDPAGGGSALNTGVHLIDLVRWLSGAEVLRVSAESARRVTRRTEDVFAAVLRLEGDRLATLNTSRGSTGRSGRIELTGETGQLCGDHVSGTLAEVRGRTTSALDPGPPVATVAAALADFVRALDAGAPPPIDALEGARNVLVVEACLRSAAQGGQSTAVEAVA
ncbi:MAG: Gfo/Idh/MocA family oxidoreductase [Deltaproteobacteria bacterium]|nr:Gfo/Idh/MocA family oxidoreductase [Deltaproteobacteria bacterium]